jgi:hypothetical protein
MTIPKIKPTKQNKDLGNAMAGSPNPQRKKQEDKENK